MIASGSFSAFSSAALDGLTQSSGLSPGGVRAPGSSPIQPARQTQTQPQAQTQPQTQTQILPLTTDPNQLGAAQTGRILPRGSLLDVSV